MQNYLGIKLRTRSAANGEMKTRRARVKLHRDLQQRTLVRERPIEVEWAVRRRQGSLCRTAWMKIVNNDDHSFIAKGKVGTKKEKHRTSFAVCCKIFLFCKILP